MDMRSESNIIDPTRMFNAKKKSRQMATNHHKLQLKSVEDTAEVLALFFDGKKDETFTLVANEETDNLHQRIQKEDHYTILFQPGDRFYSHITPNGPTAVNAARSIYDSFIKDDIDIAKLNFVGSDGTNFNVGHLSGWNHVDFYAKPSIFVPFHISNVNNSLCSSFLHDHLSSHNLGVICELEKKLGRPVQWIICQLHFIELPLKYLFRNIDGVTQGPRVFSGTIGKKLPTCETLQIQDFALTICQSYRNSLQMT